MEEKIMNEMSTEEITENVTDIVETVCDSNGGFSVGKTLAWGGIVGALGYAGYRLWKWAKAKKLSKSAGSDNVIEGDFRECDVEHDESIKESESSD